MKTIKQEKGTNIRTGVTERIEPGKADRRNYAPPRVLSAERLEAAAAACEDEPANYPATNGKDVFPGACSVLGS